MINPTIRSFYIGYLLLVDRRVICLDTIMTDLYPPLKEAALRIITGFNQTDKAILKPNELQ